MRAAERGNRRRAAWRVRRRKLQLGQARGYTQPSANPARYEIVVAPNRLSLFTNRDATLEFFAALSRLHKARRATWVNLAQTSEITQDALVVLLALLVKFKTDRLSVNGTMPKNRNARRSLDESQFIRILYEPTFEAQVSYDLGLHTHANRQIDQVHTDRLIKAASLKIWGQARRCQGVQRILIELMHNTMNHASRRPGEKHWWLSTEHAKRRVKFTFVDVGIGVFSSLDYKRPGDKWYQWKEDVLKFYSPETQQHEVLKLMLEGNMHETVTGRYYRGKGLPAIRQVMRRNQVSKLIIITNNTYADLASENFELMSVPFSGTFVYWELDRSNASCEE